MIARIALLVALALVLGAPLVLRPDVAEAPDDARRVIVITPHNEQILREFKEGFEAWHRDTYGEAAVVEYNVPGGTGEIRKLLESRYASAIEAGEPPGGTADVMFGGGTYEHGVLKQGVSVRVGGETRREPISAPVDFDDAWLESVYGANEVGDAQLYDPDRHWFGTALSAFGIIFNNDVLQSLRVPEPETWVSVADPRLRGMVAQVNPGQSGSVTTAFDALLRFRGWGEGWRILRRAGANSRFFSGSSLKPPAEVSSGNAALGVCIDFYGRYQAEAIVAAGGSATRLGYVDPPDVGMIDPDPVSMLRGAPDPEMAKRFIEYCVSDWGQALWQFRVADRHIDGLGPRHFQLRRLIVRRSMYERYTDRMIDDVNPFELAESLDDVNTDMRAFIPIVFAAMAMDNHGELKRAWSAIVEHPAFPMPQRGTVATLVTADDVDDPVLREMLRRFDAMPTVTGPDGTAYTLDTDEHVTAVKRGWLRGGWDDAGLWPREASPADAMRRTFGAFFRGQYHEIVRLGDRSR